MDVLRDDVGAKIELVPLLTEDISDIGQLLAGVHRKGPEVERALDEE